MRFVYQLWAVATPGGKILYGDGGRGPGVRSSVLECTGIWKKLILERWADGWDGIGPGIFWCFLALSGPAGSGQIVVWSSSEAFWAQWVR
jgi:hypothetical protein